MAKNAVSNTIHLFSPADIILEKPPKPPDEPFDLGVLGKACLMAALGSFGLGHFLSALLVLASVRRESVEIE
jgi:hypothetical protein